ncbi:probable disease resistance protein At4g27220 [Quercus robur]|uniref:probable disease resistance protein At4g27220 n=1 Tax=Quercus robur TaxID=38942 RepID=UPI002161874A|nr:probable disease resistance protein At4g27220 [Quercus robur]
MDPSSIITTLGVVETIKEHCGYLFHCDTNIENRRDRIENLRAKRDTLLLQKEEDKRNGKVMAPDVDNWLRDAENILLKEDKAPKKCLEIEGWGPDYYLSRKAKKKTLQIDKLLSEAASYFTQMSYSRSLTGIGSSSSEGIKHFESRTKMADKVLEALADVKVNMVLICGMGGIGKTTMAQEVEKKARDGEFFIEVVTAVVSRTPNWTEIQAKIAGTLCLNFDNKVGRANKLSSRRRNSGRVLVILDDVWQELNLGDIGIPNGGEVNCCKILLTSRSEEVLINKKKVLKIFKIDDLSEEEAWNLFREVAGDCVDTPDINSIAKEVVKECGRLPQAIVTVGAALQKKSTVEWRVALGQLQNSTPECIHGLDPTVYSSIEFSYSNLQDEAVKSCFLLCCLFPEDCDIPIEYLVRYGAGKGLFEMIDNVAVARDRVHAIIKNLQRSSLLLDSKKEECVKMHVVIRDVAISIAKNEKGFLVRCTDKIEEWPEQDTYEHSAISLVSQELKKHPDGLECPKLELLQLACGKNCTKTQTFPSNMFKEMNKLKVLSVEGMSFPSLPESILVLQNLRTLLLDYCKIEDVSEIGALGKLEILSFLGSNIKELPREIGNLSHLKLFDLSNCSALKKIPAGLLSRLNYLEELYMFGVNKEGAIASLAELKSLSKRFSALKIHIPNIEVLPKDLLFKNPELKFQIFAGEEGIYQELSGSGSYLFENSLALERSKASDIVESPVLLQLLKKSKILYLKQIKDLKNILYGLDQEGFQCLKILRVIACEDVEYVINATSHQTSHAAFPILESLEFSDLCNLKEIFHSQFPERSFSNSRLACFGNLRSLLLSRCSRLKNVFSLSIARGLVQLQQLAIDSCADMEEIFPKEGEDEKALEVIRFPELTSIKLFILPKLIGFCTTVYRNGPVQPSLNPEVRGISDDEVTSLEKHKMTDIQQHTGSFPESTSICHKFFSSKTILWSDRGTTKNSKRSSSVNKEGNLIKLKNPRASGIDNRTEILSLFPSHMIESLRNLESIKLWRCDSLEVIFQLEELNAEESHVASVLDQLRELDLSDLPKLKHIWMKGPERITGFGNLRFLAVWTCNSLTYLLSPSIAKLLVMLEDIKVINCEKIEEILERAREEEEEKKISFNKVKSILFKDLPKLKYFCNKVNAFEQPSLKERTVIRCPALSTFVPSDLNTPKIINFFRHFLCTYHNGHRQSY